MRINRTGGPPGVKTPVHMHAGSETFYVLTGELSQKTPQGVSHVPAGQSMPGRGPGIPMEVASTGTSDLVALVMFVTDATKHEMRQMLTEIQNGTYAKAWIAENEAGRPAFNKLREADRNHPIEQVGVRLRALMPFLKPIAAEDTVGAR